LEDVLIFIHVNLNIVGNGVLDNIISQQNIFHCNSIIINQIFQQNLANILTHCLQYHC